MSKKILCIIISIFVLFSFSGCASISDGISSGNDSINKKYVIQTANIDSYTQINDDDAAMVVASTVMPATLEIECTTYYSYTYYSGGFFGYGGTQTVKNAQSCQATGFVINDDGYVLTNAHVVTIENASNYSNLKYTGWDIYLNYADSDTRFNAEVVSYDVDLDLAILKMDISSIENLQHVTFFDLTNPELDEYKNEDAVKLYYGETAIAIGNAEGYGISVTKGVVSAPYRKFTENNKTEVAIQTDAAINEGNSGGPLCNKFGSVIGINSFKVVTSSSEALGYAIPSYIIIKYINDVSKDKAITINYSVTQSRAYSK